MLSLLLSLAAASQLPVLLSAEEVQIGEPIQCTVDLSGIEGVALSSEETFSPGLSWVLLGELPGAPGTVPVMPKKNS